MFDWYQFILLGGGETFFKFLVYMADQSTSWISWPHFLGHGPPRLSKPAGLNPIQNWSFSLQYMVKWVVDFSRYKIRKIYIPKGNYWILRIGLMRSLSSLQKSEFVKLIISFFCYFWCQNWDQWHKMSGKNTHIYFFYFRVKIKQVWAEKSRKKTEKIPKT